MPQLLSRCAATEKMLLVAMKIPPATTETWHSQINKSDDLKKQKIELFINTNESVIGGGGGGETSFPPDTPLLLRSPSPCAQGITQLKTKRLAANRNSARTGGLAPDSQPVTVPMGPPGRDPRQAWWCPPAAPPLSDTGGRHPRLLPLSSARCWSCHPCGPQPFCWSPG